MTAEGTIVRAVKKRRNGRRRPPRSLMAPRIGETRALSPTLVATAMPWTSCPVAWPKRESSVSHSPIATDTTA